MIYHVYEHDTRKTCIYCLIDTHAIYDLHSGSYPPTCCFASLLLLIVGTLASPLGVPRLVPLIPACTQRVERSEFPISWLGGLT